MSEDENHSTESTEESPETQGSPQLALNDLSAVIQIIDVAASRGAFRGEELSQVGGVRDRLSLFLKANLPPQEEAEEGDGTISEESPLESSLADD